MSKINTQKIFGTVVRKAWEDDSFKESLIENPKAAIESLLGEKIVIPEGKTLVVRDQTKEGTVFINIPPKLNSDDMELSENQLEFVAGGGNLNDPYYQENPFDKLLKPSPTIPDNNSNTI